MTIKLGNTTINKIYLGSTEIKKIYLGSTLIYNKTATLWTPAVLGSSVLKLWLDASDISTITKDGSNYVSQWNDKSGNGFVAAQSTGSYQPLYDSANSYSNNQPAINWYNWTNGPQTWLRLMQPDIATPATITVGDAFFLGTYKTGVETIAQDDETFMSGDLTYMTVIQGTNQLNQQSNPGRIGDFYLKTCSFNGSGSYSPVIYPLNFDIVHFLATGLLTDDFYIGATQGGYTWARKWRGPINEILVFSRNLTIMERQLMEGYLAHKWGLTAKLPSDHPYKTSPPTV